MADGVRKSQGDLASLDLNDRVRVKSEAERERSLWAFPVYGTDAPHLVARLLPHHVSRCASSHCHVDAFATSRQRRYNAIVDGVAKKTSFFIKIKSC